MLFQKHISTIGRLINYLAPKEMKKKGLCVYLVPGIDLEDVGPPPGLLPTGALDEGHSLRSCNRETVGVSGDVLGCGNLQDTSHVDPSLRYRLRLKQNRKEKKKVSFMRHR